MLVAVKFPVTWSRKAVGTPASLPLALEELSALVSLTWNKRAGVTTRDCSVSEAGECTEEKGDKVTAKGFTGDAADGMGWAALSAALSLGRVGSEEREGNGADSSWWWSGAGSAAGGRCS
jgi:hypothetical protein